MLFRSLTPQERYGLAQAMLADTIRAIQRVRNAERIFVITNYQPVLDVAEENGWEILREGRQISESDSVDAGSKICEERGVRALLRLPLDLPLIQPDDIDELLAIDCKSRSMTIVPSRDGTGTNALLRTPPTLFPSHFGEGSFAKHLAEAAHARAEVLIRRNPRLEMDVDDESDLREQHQRERNRHRKKADVAKRSRADLGRRRRVRGGDGTRVQMDRRPPD